MRVVMAAIFFGVPLILLMLRRLGPRLEFLPRSVLIQVWILLTASGRPVVLVICAIWPMVFGAHDDAMFTHLGEPFHFGANVLGIVCLYLPSAAFLIDLTICIDVQRNPDPSNQLCKFNADLCRENICLINIFDHSSHLSTGFQIMYFPLDSP